MKRILSKALAFVVIIGLVVACASIGSGKSRTETADVVVIGAGGAGIAAAMSAYQNGAKVIIIEKLAQIGGNTALSGGAFNSVNPDLQSQLGPMDDGTRAVIRDLTTKAPYDSYEA